MVDGELDPLNCPVQWGASPGLHVLVEWTDPSDEDTGRRRLRSRHCPSSQGVCPWNACSSTLALPCPSLWSRRLETWLLLRPPSVKMAMCSPHPLALMSSAALHKEGMGGVSIQEGIGINSTDGGPIPHSDNGQCYLSALNEVAAACMPTEWLLHSG